ncbi:DUF4439 domain-containing protein [Cellulomonas sp. zg-ZUI199]|uniref:DUF4439 domain-containing protein n=1 Tax=Cellulomonas wangleii TaxID=2816956 RepID=A0ABX8D9I3_9CELL|nr:DUF4439 domain-containing protein [Cellulomonas wangleii]MBO0925785.1 DUF4439 domain-containing protein [Cellulomonas wangleii]QVI63693.1 DUF4439 domain-containing protein [Cellulomonas wangleii]
MDRHRTPHPAPPTARPEARRRAPVLRLAATLVAGALALGGCGVRLESPPPAEPSPDAIEQVRARTVDDALALADAARAAAPSADEATRAVLDDVATFSDQHVEALGGVYDSGLPDATPTPAPAATSPAVTDVTGVLSALVDDAARAADDADDVPDGALARLVASVSVARDALADRLAAVTGVPRPDPALAAPDGTAGTAATATADPTVTPPGAAPTGGAAPGDATPAAAAGAKALALAHDEAAWTLAVLAARTTDERRATLLAAADGHRRASDAWAATAGVVGQPTDPRRSAYALPGGLDDPTVADALPRTLEQAVADASAQAVDDAPAGARAEAIASLRTATAAAVAWGAAPVPFPGMPELATTPVG